MPEPLVDTYGCVPARGRLLGVDFGTKRIGIAVCDREQTLASPQPQIESKSPEHDRQQYRRVVDTWEPSGIIVGLPIHSDGGESPMSTRARSHAKWLHETFELPVAMYDERYTSQEAEATLYARDATNAQRKSRIDGIAASFMLQAYLNRNEENRRIEKPTMGGQ